jgi:iron complex outermembrane receptor protein
MSLFNRGAPQRAPLPLFALLLAASPVQATSADGLDEVIVVGQRDAPLTVVPRGLSVSLAAEEFAAINAINVEDLMKYAPNFFVRKRFAGDDNAVVALRGTNTVQSARTIVMVDGFVVSNFLGNRFDFPPKWNVVGPSEVRQFDIVYGPYSARYGGNSMGGVVSVTTQDPQQSGGYLTLQSFGMPFEEYGFDETFDGYSVEGGFTWKQESGPWSVRAGFRHFENTGQSMTYNLLTPASGAGGTPVTGAYDDPRLATPVFGAASPVDVTQDQLRLRVGYETAAGWKVEGLLLGWLTQQDLTDTRSFLASTAGAPVYQGRVNYGGRVWNATGLTFSDTERTEYLAGVKLAGELGAWRSSVNLSRYWIASQDARSSRDFLTGQSSGAGTQSLPDDPGWWTLDASVEQDFGRHAVALGVNLNRYETRTDTFNVTNWREATTPVFSAATYGKTTLAGVFVEDAIALTGRTTLTAGLRADQWRAFDGGIGKRIGTADVYDAYPSRRETSVSPKLSLQTVLGPEWSVQLSLGTATRFPTVGELFQGRFDDITQAIDPQSFDPGLRAEKSTDASLMLRRSFERVQLTGSVFYQDIEDAIFSFQGLNQFGTVVSSYKNIDEVRQYGLEVIFEGRDLLIPRLDLDFSVSWMDARTVRSAANPAAEDRKFPRIPDWRANGNLRYAFTPAVRGSVGWRYATRPNSDLFGLQRGDAYGFQTEYFFVDARVSWDLNEHAQLSIGVDNVANTQAYVSHPLPQRTGFAEFRLRM